MKETRSAERPDLIILDSLAEGYYEIDLSGRFTFVNKALGRLFGLPAEEIIGLSSRKYLSKESARKILRIFERIFKTGKPERVGEIEVKLKEGSASFLELTVALRRAPDGTPAGFGGIVHNLTERKQYEKALAESEERFRTLYENATVGLYRTTPEGRVLLANPALLRMLGYDSLEDLAAIDLRKEGLGPEYSRIKFFERLKKAVILQGVEATWKKKDGSLIYIRESARAVFDSAGRIKYCEGTVEDITERKKAELELQASERKYHRIFDQSLEGIFQATVEGRVISANEAMVRMFGFGNLREFLEADVFGFFEARGAREKFLEILKAEQEIRNTELRLRRKDGSIFDALVNATVLLDETGRINRVEGTLVDITSLIQSKTALESALGEKETLLKEIHHRVKNNMQIISGLLGLQSRYITDPGAIRAFRESQNRIRTMSLIHECLYRFESRSQVDFSNYVENLVDSLYRKTAESSGGIVLKLDVEPLSFNVQTSLSLGLIINELVSNALNHAFPDNRRGTIRIGLFKPAGEEFWLSVRDDGVGLPAGFKIDRPESMGLQLIKMLADQLDGDIQLGPPPGTEFLIRFRSAAS